jgi:hypothetical protein
MVALVQRQQVAELVQRTQQFVPDVQQVGSQRCGHALQILLIILYAPLECGQCVVCVQRHVRQICTRVLRAQQLLHEAVRLFRQRLVQLVGGFVLGVAVRAPVVQLHHVQHFRHRGHYGIHAVVVFIDALSAALIAAIIDALSASSAVKCCHAIV